MMRHSRIALLSSFLPFLAGAMVPVAVSATCTIDNCAKLEQVEGVTLPPFILPMPHFSDNISSEQRQMVLRLVKEAEPRLVELAIELQQTLVALYNLSFAVDTPPDALSEIGTRLASLRRAWVDEWKALAILVKQKTGVDTGWEKEANCPHYPAFSNE